MLLQNGTRLGPYEIVSPIGAGGMGEVWRARDSRIGRDVALKVLPVSVASNADRLQRFEQEARAAGTLNHPNLVTIHELGTHEGSPYIVMELLDGETLRGKLGNESRVSADAGPQVSPSPIPPRKAIDYAIQIANGLAAAHDKGIVHRDLKPENLFVTRDGRVKILDFGLAKLSASAESSADERTQRRVTAPGTVMGTAGYMSPEQVRGQNVDHRSDIFSLGAIVYEMLSGKRAFHGSSSVETMNSILRDDPPELVSDTARVAPAIERLVRRCLEKSPDERFHSAHDLAYALDVVSNTSGSSRETALANGPRRRIAPFLIVAACLAFAALGYLAASRLRPAEHQPVPDFVQLTFNEGIETHPSIAPDGKSFAYASKQADNFDIYVQRIGGTNTINLTRTSSDDDLQPAFSPDGQFIAFRSAREGGGLYVMGATGESVRRLSGIGFDPAWSPDGKRVVFATEGVISPYTRTGNSLLWTVDVATGATRKIEGTGDAVQPKWSPNNQRIAYWSTHQGRRVIQTIPVTGGKPTPIMTEIPLNWNPVWSSDGTTLFFGSDRSGPASLWRVAIDETTGETRGRPQPLTASSDEEGFVSVARDGTMVFRRARGDGHLYEIPFDPKTMTLSGPPVQALPGSRRVGSADLSHDREWLTFWTIGGVEDIYVMRRDNSELRQVTNDPARDRKPLWSPDGTRIAFYSNRGGEYDVWTIRPDGSEARQLTHRQHAYDSPWSPDGKSLAVATDDEALLVSSTGSAATQVLSSGPDLRFFPTSWTLDGSRICGALREKATEQRKGSAVFHMGTRRMEKVTDSSGWPLCAGNHAMLILSSKLEVLDLRTKKMTDLGGFAFAGRRATISGDGKSIFAPSHNTEADIWMMRFEDHAQQPRD